jgi:NAD(P)-dependent dehydrogenase (short-subunit alcohol dehydrogenase family)
MQLHTCTSYIDTPKLSCLLHTGRFVGKIGMSFLPSNEVLVAFSQDAPWNEIERQKRLFNQTLDTLTGESNDDTLPLERLSTLLGSPVRLYYPEDASGANVVLADIGGRQIVLGSVVAKRYRSGKNFLESLVRYNLNPSVNHTNIHETEDSMTRMRVLGAEIEMGLLHPDGRSPSEDEVQKFMRAYYNHAIQIGVYPYLDREACQYQIEAHIAPSVGYHKTRSALNGMLRSLALTAEETGMRPAILPSYPTESDFKMTDYPKVQTAVDLMIGVNNMFPNYVQQLDEIKARYHVKEGHYVNLFRNQGTHIHIDLAGRSEALGLLTYHTMLKSATALANSAVLKGCPFVNGTCDSELLCTREYLRSVTVTGRYLDLPLSPHYRPEDLFRYAELLRLERANATGRAMMFDEYQGEMVSLMHNPIGRVRPDLSTSKRVCTVESTGMPTNISAARMAAVLVDFEFSHALIEAYFRKYGCDLGPMRDDKTLWAILGPLDRETFIQGQNASDRECTDAVVTTAAGTQMTLGEFYEMKRRYMHRALDEIAEITPRDIDDVYSSLTRMLEPLSGHVAQTIQQYVNDPKLRSTGNWGKILRNAYVEAGGVIGGHCPDAVLSVVNQMYDAMRIRYLES